MGFMKNLIGTKPSMPMGGLPDLGAVTPPARPAGIDSETYKNISELVDGFIETIKQEEYIERVTKLVDYLEAQAVIKGIVNNDIPRIWDIFGEKLAKAAAKITDSEERAKEFTQQDFTVIWQIFAQRHNNRLHKLKFADFVNAERDNNERSGSKYSGATDVDTPDDND